MITFYGYDKCSTCRNAKKWLTEHGIKFQFIDITKEPPPAETFREILSQGEYSLRDLFNTSGQMYRQLDMKTKLNDMSDEEAVELLSQNGMLVKRPVVTDGDRHTVGFNEERYEQVWA